MKTRIKLSPQFRDDKLVVIRDGKRFTVNGELFDFSRMEDGDTLPFEAITSEWIVNGADYKDGEFIITFLSPIPKNATHEQAFPEDMLDVPEGFVIFPGMGPEDTQGEAQ